jgi:hypothetical protein
MEIIEPLGWSPCMKIARRAVGGGRLAVGEDVGTLPLLAPTAHRRPPPASFKSPILPRVPRTGHTMRIAPLALLLALPACSRHDRDAEFKQCVDIYRTTYVAGKVSDCLVERYGWSRNEAARVEREKLAGAHPDSASRGDSGRMGDSARR